MHAAQVTAAGSRIRWTELPGSPDRTRVYIHGLGATSGPYFTPGAVHPALAGHRSLLIDLLGFGISDCPEDFGYTLEDHADTLASALRSAQVSAAEVIGHSMGGSVAILLAARHPDLVARLVLIDANLDPLTPHRGAVGSSGIASYTEQEFLDGGWREVRDAVGAHWWATMRLADRRALYRSAVHLARGSEPTMRQQLLDLKIPRAYLYPLDHEPPAGREQLESGGIAVVGIADSGHNIMLDNTDTFARETARLLALDDRP